jgi:hypothetical protein
MNPRVTLGFLAAALILTGVVVGLDRFNVGPTASNLANATATTTAAQQPQIFTFDDSKVTTFEIRQADKSVRIQKQNDAWVVSGTGEPANRSSFTSLIVRMSTLKATRLVDTAPADVSQYGLDAPRDTAIATMDDGTTYQLDLGIKTPVQSGTYARASGAPTVYVVADQFSSDLERLITDPKEPPTIAHDATDSTRVDSRIHRGWHLTCSRLRARPISDDRPPGQPFTMR